MGLLSGLFKFGLGDLEDRELFDREDERKARRALNDIENTKLPEKTEEDVLFDKSYTCPVCDNAFKVRTVRSGKVKMIGSDTDLRPLYELVDVLKYDTIVCPNCGYSALSRYYDHIASVQKKLVREAICSKFVPQTFTSKVYTYEEAYDRYQLVLANTIVKRGKPSEKAFVCLKAAWLLRGMLEHLEMNPSYVRKKVLYTRQEETYLRYAYDGFLSARSTEPFPMCGMDEETVDYLLAALALRFSEFDLCGRLISQLLSSRTAKKRTKDRARLLKDELGEAISKAKLKEEKEKEEKRKKEEKEKAEREKAEKEKAEKAEE